MSLQISKYSTISEARRHDWSLESKRMGEAIRYAGAKRVGSQSGKPSEYIGFDCEFQIEHSKAKYRPRLTVRYDVESDNFTILLVDRPLRLEELQCLEMACIALFLLGYDTSEIEAKRGVVIDATRKIELQHRFCEEQPVEFWPIAWQVATYPERAELFPSLALDDSGELFVVEYHHIGKSWLPWENYYEPTSRAECEKIMRMGQRGYGYYWEFRIVPFVEKVPDPMYRIQIAAFTRNNLIHVRYPCGTVKEVGTWTRPVWLHFTDGTIVHAYQTLQEHGEPIQNIEVIQEGCAAWNREFVLVDGWSDLLTLSLEEKFYFEKAAYESPMLAEVVS